MVVIGHSMGGCITRTLITDPGMKLWIAAFGKPPEQTKITEPKVNASWKKGSSSSIGQKLGA